MKKTLILVFTLLSLFFVDCTDQNIAKLNNYWEEACSTNTATSYERFIFKSDSNFWIVNNSGDLQIDYITLFLKRRSAAKDSSCKMYWSWAKGLNTLDAYVQFRSKDILFNGSRKSSEIPKDRYLVAACDSIDEILWRNAVLSNRRDDFQTYFNDTKYYIPLNTDWSNEREQRHKEEYSKLIHHIENLIAYKGITKLEAHITTDRQSTITQIMMNNDLLTQQPAEYLFPNNGFVFLIISLDITVSETIELFNFARGVSLYTNANSIEPIASRYSSAEGWDAVHTSVNYNLTKNFPTRRQYLFSIKKEQVDSAKLVVFDQELSLNDIILKKQK